MKKKPFVICMAVIACIAVAASAYSVFAKQFVNLKGEKISYKSVSSASASAKSKTPAASTAECSVQQTPTQPTTEKEPQGNNNGTSSSMPYLIKVNKTQNIVIIYKQDDSANIPFPLRQWCAPSVKRATLRQAHSKQAINILGACLKEMFTVNTQQG